MDAVGGWASLYIYIYEGLNLSRFPTGGEVAEQLCGFHFWIMRNVFAEPNILDFLLWEAKEKKRG